VAIRIRTVDGVRVALCAAETDAQPGDLYLDDGDHYALSAKYAADYQGRTIDWGYPEQWAAMATQKKRDAEEALAAWDWAGRPDGQAFDVDAAIAAMRAALPSAEAGR
jgi:hypothetical protein